MGLFSLAGKIIGGGKLKKASKKAQATQVEALNSAIGEQRRQFDLTRADYAPYLQTGLSGLTGLGDLIGVNGADAQREGLVSIENSPVLAALLRNGEEAILQNGAATGGLRGGNLQRSLADFRADTFADQLNQQIARLAGLAGLGQGATDSVSGFGANSTDNISSLLGAIGGVNSNAILQRGGINASLWNSAGQFLDKTASNIASGGMSSLFSKIKGLF